LERALELATTDEERRELKQQLADATANLIDAETAAEIVRLESAQLNRELDQEELDRLEELRQAKADADEEEAERKRKAREKELAEVKTQNEALANAEQALQDARRAAIQAGFNLASSIAGENEKVQNALFVAEKAVAVGQVILDTIKAKSANAAYASTLGPVAGPIYLTTQNAAANLRLATSLASIAAASIAKFKGGASPSAAGGGGSAPNPSAAINYNLGGNQQAGAIIEPGQASTGVTPTQTYVLASDVTSAQEAQSQIENLARL
jgi:alanyl-tRNA synthetase